MELDLETGMQLICKAKDQEREARIFQQWVAQLPVMAIGGDIISFDDYRDRVTGANIDFRPTEDILQELEDVESQFEGGAAGDGG